MDVDAETAAGTTTDASGTPAARAQIDVPPKLIPIFSSWRDQHITLNLDAADLEQLELQVEQSRALHEGNQEELNKAETRDHSGIGDERYINEHIDPLKLKLADSGAQLDTFIEIRDQVKSKHDESVKRYKKFNDEITDLTPELSVQDRQQMIDHNVKLSATTAAEESHNALLQGELEQKAEHYRKLVQSAVDKAHSKLQAFLCHACCARGFLANMAGIRLVLLLQNAP